MRDYAQTRLFQPLGIDNVVWGSDPAGVTFGGGNLFLSAVEMSRIGRLCLYNGRWQGQQLVPAAWLQRSWQPYQTCLHGWEYGYYWYLHPEKTEPSDSFVMTYLAAGAGGQRLLLIPDLRTVLTVTAKTDFVGERSVHLNHAVRQILIPALQTVDFSGSGTGPHQKHNRVRNFG